MRLIAGARFLETVVGQKVVIAIGEPEIAGMDVRDHVTGIVVVGHAGESERRRDAEIMELADHDAEVLGLGDPEEDRIDRLRAELVGTRFVHARRVVIADELLDAAGGPIGASGGLFEDLVQLILGGLARRPAATPALHVVRDRVVGAPGAVRVSVEVDAGIGGVVEVAGLDAVANALDAAGAGARRRDETESGKDLAHGREA